MNKSYCPRCGKRTLLVEGVKGGKSAWLMYDKGGDKQHRLSCSKIKKRKPT